MVQETFVGKKGKEKRWKKEGRREKKGGGGRYRWKEGIKTRNVFLTLYLKINFFCTSQDGDVCPWSITVFMFGEIWGVASTDENYPIFLFLFLKVLTMESGVSELNILDLTLLGCLSLKNLSCLLILLSSLCSTANSTIPRGSSWGSSGITEAKGWPRRYSDAACQFHSVTPAPQICFDWPLLPQTSSKKEDIRVWGGCHTFHVPARSPFSFHVYWSPQCFWIPGCSLCAMDCHLGPGIPSILLDHGAPWETGECIGSLPQTEENKVFCSCIHAMWVPQTPHVKPILRPHVRAWS